MQNQLTNQRVVISKLTFNGKQAQLANLLSEFKSHWIPHSYGLVPRLSKKPSKLQTLQVMFTQEFMLKWGPLDIAFTSLIQVKQFSKYYT